MAEVAATAGVSVSTVSHVLNQTRPVSDELTTKVQEAVVTTGYRPNVLARSLATSTTKLIGIVMTATSNPLFAPLFSAMEGIARRHGYTVLLADNHDDTKLEAAQVSVLLDHRVAGIVLASAATGPTPMLDMLYARQVPIVLVDRFADDRFDQVGTENVAATGVLVDHLVGLGHQRIGFVGGRRGLSTTVERLHGYRLAMEKAGLHLDRHLIRSGGSQVEVAHSAVAKLLAADERPTAIVSANNRMSIGVLRALRQASLRVPEDIAVVGYDDIEWADLLDPALTVIAQPVVEIGRRAISLLLARIGDLERPLHHDRLDPTFVHRQSCGCGRDSPSSHKLLVQC